MAIKTCSKDFFRSCGWRGDWFQYPRPLFNLSLFLKVQQELEP